MTSGSRPVGAACRTLVSPPGALLFRRLARYPCGNESKAALHLAELTRSGGPAPTSRLRGRFSTRRRLIVVFSAVLAASLSALVLQIRGLYRMEGGPAGVVGA